MALRTVDGEVLEVRQCYACGEGFGSSGPDDALCMKCLKDREARDKPQHLASLEHIAASGQPRNDVERSFHQMLMKKPHDFLSRLSSLQQAYTERYKALQAIEEARRPAPATDCPNQSPKDESTERIVDLIDRLLKECS